MARKELSLQEKVEVLRFLENSSERKAAHVFGISKTTVNNIKKRKGEILERIESENGELCRKRRKTSNYPVNEATLLWFQRMKALNLRVSGPMIQQAALTFAQQLGIEDFHASSGWLESFKKRNLISHNKVCSELNEAPQETANMFNISFNDISHGFHEKDVFNADECGLVYRAIPDKMLILEEDYLKAGNVPEERLTILLAANCYGEKLPAFVIGRDNISGCFKAIKVDNLPVIWKSNSSSWMISSLFSEWLDIVNKKMKEDGRKILIFVDKCEAHNVLTELSNVTVKFLPLNTTSVLKPFEQGIFQNFKSHYRKFFLTSLIAKSEEINSLSPYVESVTVLDAVYWISEAWNLIEESTVRKCFLKAGFTKAQELTASISNDIYEQSQVNKDIEILIQLLPLDKMSSDECIGFDNCIPVREALTEEAIIETVLSELSDKNENETRQMDEEEDSIDKNETNSIITIKEAAKMLEKLKTFSLQHSSDLYFNVLRLENEFNNYIVCKKEY